MKTVHNNYGSDFMKKLILILLCTVFCMDVNAYSDKIIPGGETIGIDIKTDGIIITGFYKVNNKLNNSNPKLQSGDTIKFVNNIKVDTSDDLLNAMKDNMRNNEVTLTIDRNGKLFDSKMEIYEENNTYKTGLYVKDSILGIGTLSYIDPESKVYGALGHEVNETETSKKVEVKEGEIFKSKVTSIDKSSRGNPGEKNAKFYKEVVYGDINKNEITGIFGDFRYKLPEKKELPVGKASDIKKGKAFIQTVIHGEKVESFEINISKLDFNNDTKNIYFEVTDKRLLEKSGGIIQGMSGSPIIQDDKIIGAVSHVIVDNPANGYGVSIVKMLEEGDKLN